MAKRILVVNDTQAILELFRIILEEEGYEVILSGFPFENIREVEQIKPDLIILDFIFGEYKTGWQMLQMLKMQRSTASIPVIICTAAIREVQETEGYLVSRGVLILFKPFDIDNLLSMVNQALKTPAHVASLVDDETTAKNKK